MLQLAAGIDANMNMTNFYFVVPDGDTFANFSWQPFQNIPNEEASTSDRGPKRARNIPVQDVGMYLARIEEYVLAIEFPEQKQ